MFFLNLKNSWGIGLNTNLLYSIIMMGGGLVGCKLRFRNSLGTILSHIFHQIIILNDFILGSHHRIGCLGSSNFLCWWRLNNFFSNNASFLPWPNRVQVVVWITEYSFSSQLWYSYCLLFYCRASERHY